MGQKFSFKQKAILLLVSILGPILIYIYGFTWRVKWSETDNLNNAKTKADNVIYALWHSRVLMLCHIYRFQKIGIMVSKSFDGEWIGRTIRRLGYRIFRGSSSKDGASALHMMIKAKDEGEFALMVDGPRGPAQKVKPGVVTLASQTGMPIVPITCIAEKAWLVKSWDKLVIPKPFSKITVIYGKPVFVAMEMDKDMLKDNVKLVESELLAIG
jgi:lysophospholipid acyltransferase (LPLAT)-like uncharacterized protein